jgi:CubicO group peptidase (beta-lactamase class C family)
MSARSICAGLLLCSLALPVAAQQTTGAEAVDAVFQAWNSADSPGCAVATAHDGRTVLQRAYGRADLEHDVPNRPTTIFEAGSVAKQFTAAAVMLLALDDRLTLDDDVRRYIPELPDYGHTIRLRHLLNHTSGLRDWGSVAEIAGMGRSHRTHTHDHVLDILSRQRALNFTPGAEYSYSNSGYNLLAVIVERVSGQPFATFSKEHIFEPLGMSDTQWRDDYTRLVKGRASAYRFWGGSYVIDRPIENVHGNGGLLTTVGDLLLWNHALAAGQLGGSRFIELMHEQGVLNDGSTITYAAGLSVTRYQNVPEVSHTGATSGYRAFLARYPDQRLDVAVLCNAGNVNPGTVGREVAAAFLGSALQPVDAVRPMAASSGALQRVAPSAAELAEYAGEYHSADAETTFTLSVEGDSLRLFRRPATTMTLRPYVADAFDAQVGRIRFIRDDRGVVTQLSVAQSRVYDLRFDRIR